MNEETHDEQSMKSLNKESFRPYTYMSLPHFLTLIPIKLYL